MHRIRKADSGEHYVRGSTSVRLWCSDGFCLRSKVSKIKLKSKYCIFFTHSPFLPLSFPTHIYNFYSGSYLHACPSLSKKEYRYWLVVVCCLRAWTWKAILPLRHFTHDTMSSSVYASLDWQTAVHQHSNATSGGGTSWSISGVDLLATKQPDFLSGKQERRTPSVILKLCSITYLNRLHHAWWILHSLFFQRIYSLSNSWLVWIKRKWKRERERKKRDGRQGSWKLCEDSI